MADTDLDAATPEQVETFREEATASGGAPSAGGLRAGAVVFVGVMALNAATYGFYFVSAHALGPATYSDLATLITLIGLVSLPLAGAQVWFARRVAHLRAIGEPEAVSSFASIAVRYVGAGALVATVVALILAPLAAWRLGIASYSATELAALTTFPAVVAPMAAGLVQGLERFTLLAWTYAAGPISRLSFALVGFELGFGLDGAILATVLSMFIGITVALWPLRRLFADPPRTMSSGGLARGLSSFAGTLIGLLAITLLTTSDIVVAKVALPSEAAGTYSSASVIARVVLYLPAAVVAVLLPRVAARTAQRLSSLSLLAKSVGVTLAFCLTGVAIYAAVPHLVLRLTFGKDYAAAAPLLWRLGFAMTLFAVLNLLLVYDLAQGNSRVAWLLSTGAAIQLLAFTMFHSSSETLVRVDTAVAVALVCGHEVITRGLLLRAIATTLGLRGTRGRSVVADDYRD